MRVTRLLSVCCLAVFGQTRPTFDVAVVKPAGPATSWTVHTGIEGGPGTPDPGRISYAHLNLKTLLWMAYNVTPLQISGPPWLDSDRYDVLANVPPGSSKDQVAVMLQNLLVDRFQIALHHEKRELAVYALVVGNKGATLRPSAEISLKDDSQQTFAQEGRSASKGHPEPSHDKYGFPALPEGRTGMYPIGGNKRLIAREVSMERLAIDWLTGEVGRIVLDMTGLKGSYDFTLTFESNTRPSGNPGDKGNPSASTPDRVAAPSIFDAVQGQLGLKLESRKSPVDVLVVDRANKVPDEN